MPGFSVITNEPVHSTTEMLPSLENSSLEMAETRSQKSCFNPRTVPSVLFSFLEQR